MTANVLMTREGQTVYKIVTVVKMVHVVSILGLAYAILANMDQSVKIVSILPRSDTPKKSSLVIFSRHRLKSSYKLPSV